eukprot:3538615-Lingulodinium_polyedra.AAC.1
MSPPDFARRNTSLSAPLMHITPSSRLVFKNRALATSRGPSFFAVALAVVMSLRSLSLPE